MRNISDDMRKNIYKSPPVNCAYILTTKDLYIVDIKSAVSMGDLIYEVFEVIGNDAEILADSGKHSSMKDGYKVGYAQALINQHMPKNRTRATITSVSATLTAEGKPSNTALEGVPESIKELIAKDPVNGTQALLQYYKALTMQEQYFMMQKADKAANDLEDRVHALERQVGVILSNS